MTNLRRWPSSRGRGLPPAASALAPETDNNYWLPLADVLLVLIAFSALLIPNRLGLPGAVGDHLPIRINAAGEASVQGRPLTLRRLPALVKAYSELKPAGRLRLLPDPRAPWGALGPVLLLLKDSPTPVDLKLPGASLNP
ncbi:MAG: hypothetical protein RLZZ158_821 [Cyanobacteriota bacterium]|jgi:hypothetical protein